MYFKNMLIDPSYIKQSLFWHKNIKKTQLNEKLALFLDRQLEIKEFFKINNSFLLKYYLKYGFPNTPKFKNKLINFFENSTNKDNELKKAYEEASFDYTLRLMLTYERYSLIIPYMDFIIKALKKPFEELEILDYGCGVSDIGLLFASLGAKVTLADLDDKKSEFALWRFKKRNLIPNFISIKNISDYPILPENKYDLIIATEIFEHVRNPLKLLRNFTNALKTNCFLFDSMGKNFERKIIGDHLKEAISIGQSEEYKNYYNSKFTQIPLKNLDYLFKKK